MMRMLALSLLIAAPVAARADTPISIAADAPELAPRGAFQAGTRQITVTLPDRPDLRASNFVTGAMARGPRKLPVVLWYPAPATAKPAATEYEMPTPTVGGDGPAVPATVSFAGAAVRDAAPAPGRFPLVVLSHGFGNRAVMFSELAENLASKGYIVAAIEHGDATLQGDRTPRELAALEAIVQRGADQRGVIAELIARAAAGRDPVLAHADPDRMALGGFSMGAFGALSTAGAGYDPKSPLASRIPGGLLTPLTEGNARPIPGIKALILFGPWGGGPDVRMWTPASLGSVQAPTLIVDGDQDDVADFAGGVRWMFDTLVNSERYLLVYREARHNIAMNAAPATLRGDHRFLDRYDEPVWRKDRILAVNAHFVTAFLDWKLKGEADRAGYLNVPTPVSDAGEWLLAPNEATGGRVASGTGASASYWRGFQRRWAVGLELHRRAPQD